MKLSISLNVSHLDFALDLLMLSIRPVRILISPWFSVQIFCWRFCSWNRLLLIEYSVLRLLLLAISKIDANTNGEHDSHDNTNNEKSNKWIQSVSFFLRLVIVPKNCFLFFSFGKNSKFTKKTGYKKIRLTVYPLLLQAQRSQSRSS